MIYYFTLYTLISGATMTGIFLRSVFKHQITVTLLDILGSATLGFCIGFLLLPIYGVFMLDKIRIR